MSATPTDKEFRKVDVDKYDEDAYQEEAEEMHLISNESEISSAIDGQKFADALKLICGSSVLTGAAKREVKAKLVALFSRVLLSVKAGDIDKLIDQLSEDEQNTLMKLLYLTFSLKADSDYNAVHQWHDRLYSKIGLGGIVRVLTDRKAVVL